MALVEMDEAEVLNLRKIAGTVQKMLANPETRGRILEAQKILNPDAIIPEIDATKPLRAEIAKASQSVEDLKKVIADEKAERAQERVMEKLKSKWDEGRAVARKAGYTADGLEALEKYMEEKGVADHEIAMASFEKLHPPEAPVDTTSNRFDAFTTMPKDGDDMKLLLSGNDREFTAKRIKETLSNIRGR